MLDGHPRAALGDAVEKPSPCSQLEVVEHPTLGPFLVVSTGGIFVKNLFEPRFEGPTYAATFAWGRSSRNPLAPAKMLMTCSSTGYG